MLFTISKVGFSAFVAALRTSSVTAGRGSLGHVSKNSSKIRASFDKRRLLTVGQSTMVSSAQIMATSYLTQEVVSIVCETFDIENEDVEAILKALESYDSTGMLSELAFGVVSAGLLYGTKAISSRLKTRVKINGKPVTSRTDMEYKEGDIITQEVYEVVTNNDLKKETTGIPTEVLSGLVVNGKPKITRTSLQGTDISVLLNDSLSVRDAKVSFAALSLLTAGMWGNDILEEEAAASKSSIPRTLSPIERAKIERAVMAVPQGETVWSFQSKVIWMGGEEVRLADLHKFLLATLTHRQQNIDVLKPGNTDLTRLANSGAVIRALHEGLRRLEEGRIGYYLDVLVAILEDEENAYQTYFTLCGRINKNATESSVA
jgi:hypothetical protein